MYYETRALGGTFEGTICTKTRRFFALRPIDVAILVCADYLLTVHPQPVSLPGLVPPYSTEGRSEQYAVYAVLDGLVMTAFDALNEVEAELEDLERAATDMRGAECE